MRSQSVSLVPPAWCWCRFSRQISGQRSASPSHRREIFDRVSPRFTSYSKRVSPTRTVTVPGCNVLAPESCASGAVALGGGVPTSVCGLAASATTAVPASPNSIRWRGAGSCHRGTRQPRTTRTRLPRSSSTSALQASQSSPTTPGTIKSASPRRRRSPTTNVVTASQDGTSSAGEPKNNASTAGGTATSATTPIRARATARVRRHACPRIRGFAVSATQIVG
ncbi:hypothetical protein B0I29_13326 [Actinoplanes lutulentus]|uniref:Uncharacterized protein n=1 Tax=Actinoplanes lutulentus TaxID=1287878 RepID=A0A327YWV1_9ACTN|nr:hypothetical protein B0I29_13326 [Actinoplanes lutulentus]